MYLIPASNGITTKIIDQQIIEQLNCIVKYLPSLIIARGTYFFVSTVKILYWKSPVLLRFKPMYMLFTIPPINIVLYNHYKRTNKKKN